MTFTSASHPIFVVECANIGVNIAIGVSSNASAKDARLRERRLKHRGSGKAELRKRLQNSPQPVSQIGAGRSEMGQPTVYQKHSTLPSREDDV
jgi:hypothetical protein